MFDRDKMTKKSIKNLHDEIQILRNLESPYIINLHDTFKTDRHFYLILDYCNGGDLEGLLENRLLISEREVRMVF